MGIMCKSGAEVIPSYSEHQLRRLEENLESLFDEREEVSALTEHMLCLQQNLEVVVLKLTKSLTKAEVKNNDFHEQVRKHKKVSRYYLGLILVLLLGNFCYATWSITQTWIEPEQPPFDFFTQCIRPSWISASSWFVWLY